MSKDHSAKVHNHFAKEWEKYDSKIEKVIPYYSESFSTLLSVINNAIKAPGRILEIGVGTGNLTGHLLRTFPDASLLGIDLVQDYILQARRKLAKHQHRIQLIAKDITEFEFTEKYDLIVTSYVFHLVENEAQSRVYKAIFEHLNLDGMFVNADFVDSASPYFSSLFDKLRIDFLRDQGIEEDSIRADYVEHRNLEVPMPLEDQIEMLYMIGFKEVECFWKYLNLAVFGGKKLS